MYKLLLNEIYTTGTTLIKTPPTKININKQNSYLDHIFSNVPQKISGQNIIRNGYSDHYLIQLYRKSKNPKCHPTYRITRDYNKINWDKVREGLASDIMITNSTLSNSPEEISQNIIQSITNHLDEQAPIQRQQIKIKVPKFTTQETNDLIKSRDESLALMKITGNQDDIRDYKTKRNLVHKMITRDKNDNMTEKFQKITKNDAKNQWNEMKNTIGWQKTTTPKIISQNGVITTSPKEIAKEINFSNLSRINRLHRENPKVNQDPLEHYKKLMLNKKCKFQLKTINMSELRKIMSKTKPTNSTGIDQLSMKTLKEIFKPIEGAVLNLINTSISTSTYPSNLKTSKAIPLLKAGKLPQDPLSYRLINLLPCLSKIIDKVIYKQVLEYLDRNSIIPHQYHGGRKGRSTITAVSTMLDTWALNYEQGQDLAVIVLDQSAAYDTISHKILIDKMSILGFQENTTKYFTSYLTDRQQSVYVDGFLSDSLHIGQVSVVQGSVLSCLLYLIYIMDLPLLFEDTPVSPQNTDMKTTPEISTFVDDTVCTVKLNPTVIHNQDNINQVIHKLEIYMRSNSLIVNTEKTKFVVISINENVRKNLFLVTEAKNIRPVRFFKFLGITIEDNLTWNAYLTEGKESLISQLKKRLNSLRKA